MDQLELQYYEAQLELYDTKFNVLRNEELLLVAQIGTVRRQMKGTPSSVAPSRGSHTRALGHRRALGSHGQASVVLLASLIVL